MQELDDTKTESVETFITTDELLKEYPNTSPVPILPQLSVALGILVFVFSVTYIGLSTPKTVPKNTSAAVSINTKLPSTAQNTDISPESFNNMYLQAASAIVWDVKTQRILFNKNADDVRPLASITKLMTALVAADLLDPSENIKITSQVLETEGDSGFVDGETFSAQDLIDMTLVSSSNDGAEALGITAGSVIEENGNAEKAFVHAMNVRAEDLGLYKTNFLNSTGLDISSDKAGAYGTARDVAILMEYLVTQRPEILAQTDLTEMSIVNGSGQSHQSKNTNTVTDEINNLIGSKTGYTPLAGGNLAIAFDAGLNRPIIIVVLGSTQQGRFDDILTLVDRAQAHVAVSNE